MWVRPTAEHAFVTPATRSGAGLTDGWKKGSGPMTRPHYLPPDVHNMPIPDLVWVGPYPDKLQECDECGSKHPWIHMHDSKVSSLYQVCQGCHDKGY